MKPKDNGFLQQHIEKIVMGVALLFVLVVLWLYVLGSPYSITLGSADAVPPDEVMTKVKQKADQLDRRLKASESPLPDTPVPDYTQEFLNRYRRPPLSIDAYQVAFNGPGLGGFERLEEETRLVEMPPLPAPQDIKARGGFDVLAEFADPRQAEPFLKLIGNEVPRDFRYASASAVFPLDQFHAAMKAVPAERRVPEAWWRGWLLVTAVELWRQELDPATGKWTEARRVPLLPNQIAYGIEGHEAPQVDALQLRDMLLAQQDYIQRTPFPPTLNAWTPPDADLGSLSPEDQRKLLKLDSDIAALRRQIQAMERRQGGPERPERPVRPGAVIRGPRELGDPVGDMIAPPMPGPGPGGEGGSPLDQLRQQLIQKVTERNALLGVQANTPDGGMPPGGEAWDEWGNPVAQPMAPRGSAPMPPGMHPGMDPAFGGQFGGMGPQGQAIETTAQVKVWAHDLTVQPGRTYRYALVVHLLNPLYQKPSLEASQKEENFDKLALASPASPWSGPVVIEPATRFFLIAASPNSAKLEVWRIFNGRYETRAIDVRPGEVMAGEVDVPVGDQMVELPMRINGMVVDVRDTGGGGPLSNTTYELLWVDLDTGAIRVRNLARDQNDPELTRLRAEKARETVALQP